MYCCSFVENRIDQDEFNSAPEIDKRQGSLLPVIGIPFLASALPAAAAAVIGLYGSYTEEFRYIYNLIFGKPSPKICKAKIVFKKFAFTFLSYDYIFQT